MEKRNQDAEKAFRGFIEAYLVKRDAAETLAFFAEDALYAGTGLTGTTDAFGAVAEAEIAADPAGYHVTWNRLESRALCADYADVYAELTAERDGIRFHLELTASLVAQEGRYYIVLLHSSAPGDEALSDHYSGGVERRMQERVKNEALRLLNETVAGGLMGVYLEPGYPLYFINEQMLRYLGYTYDEFMEATGGYVQACIVAEDYDGMNRQLESCLKAGDDYDVRYRLRKKDGTAIWVVERGRRVRVGADHREAAVSVCIDVTEMVELQQQVTEKAAVLADKNRELEELTDKIPSGVQKCRVDGSGSFVYLSSGFLKITGYTHEEIRTLYHDSMFEMVAEQDRERVREEFAKQAANNEKLALEYRICHKGPGELWVFNRGEIAEENGELFFYCVVLDVTDVHELKWFYKHLLDSLPTALVILDEERRLTLINQSAEKLFHIRAEDYLGKTDQFGEDALDPTGGTTQERYYLQEGRRWKLVHIPMFDDEGANRGCICAFTDVTELETLNATLQFLNDNAPGGICEVKLNGSFTLIFANEAFYHILGYTPAQLREELDNKLILLTHPDDVDLFQAVIQNARESGQKNFEYEKRVRRRDGSVIWLLVRGAFTKNAGETVLSCIVIDTTERHALTEKLQMNEERLRVALEQTSNVIFDYDLKRGVIEHPERSVALYGLPPVITNVPASFVEQKVCFEEDVPQFIAMYEKIQKGEPHASCVVRVHVADGEYIWNRVSLTTLYDRDGLPVRAIGVAEDITRQKRAELLYRQEEQYRSAMLSEALLTYEIDLTQNRLYVDKDEWVHRSGTEPAQSYSKSLEAVCGQVVFPEDRKSVLERFGRENLMAAFAHGETELHFEYRLKMEGGVYRWVSKTMHLLEDPETGNLKGFTYLKDIDAQKREELALKFRSERDALTGLCNKAFAEKQTRDALLDVGEDRFHALMIVDSDNFKQVNDTYGHMLGDQVLRECSRRIRYLFRDDDVVGRIGGDEFLVCLRNISTAQVAADKAAGICEAFREKFRFGEKLITLSSSVGVALFPQDGETFEELYERADLALYEAKRCGKNNYCFYEEELSKEGQKLHAEQWEPLEQSETRQKGIRGGYRHRLPVLPGQRRKTYTAVSVLMLTALLSIAALCIGYLAYFDQMIRQENREYLREASGQVMSNVTQMVQSNHVQMESLAADINSGAVNTMPEALELMRKEKGIWGYSYLALMDQDGNLIATDLDFNLEPFREDFEKLSASGEENADLLYSEDLKTQFLAFFMPVEEKQLDGLGIKAVVACYDLNNLRFGPLNDVGYTYLVHGDGTILLNSDSVGALPGENLFSALDGVQLNSDYNTRQIRIDFQLRNPGFLEYNDGSAEKYLLYVPMGLNDWYLVTVVPAETIGDNTRALFHFTILVVVLIAVLFSAVLLLFLVVQMYNRRRLEHIAFVDPVTGGNNKRRFE
ncbi:MAG: PAS domain-containing protein [Oscillospiraceae bacterium]|jgi:diguanylate cyclase (GGDEF)-like protein/PAS domain S-box-containing protein